MRKLEKEMKYFNQKWYVRYKLVKEIELESLDVCRIDVCRTKIVFQGRFLDKTSYGVVSVVNQDFPGPLSIDWGIISKFRN